MEPEPGDWLVGTMMVAFALVGLVLASGAWDTGMYVFGLSLTAFGWLFAMGLVKRHYDMADAARVRVARHV